MLVSAVIQAEMRLGARLLPAGKRRDALQRGLRLLFDEDFAQRILPFDAEAVPHDVDVVARRRAAGRPISQCDAQIAAIAFEVATWFQATLTFGTCRHVARLLESRPPQRRRRAVTSGRLIREQ